MNAKNIDQRSLDPDDHDHFFDQLSSSQNNRNAGKWGDLRIGIICGIRFAGPSRLI
jgi:hypothetical protein